MAILLNFQPNAGYYEKNLDKEFPPENFPNNRPYGPNYILKFSAQTDKFFLRYRLLQKWTIFRAVAQVKHVRWETVGSGRFPVKSSDRTKTPVPLSVSGFFPANSGARK
jgi:hypothetical protein